MGQQEPFTEVGKLNKVWVWEKVQEMDKILSKYYTF